MEELDIYLVNKLSVNNMNKITKKDIKKELYNIWS